VSKTKNPVWNVPASIQREHAQKGDPLPSSVPSGPNNPLGDYAMRLARSSYLIHGTNKPYGVGMQMSHGCLNLYPEDIKELFNSTKIGTPVMIVDQPYLLGRYHDMLFLEAHKPLQASKNAKQALLSQIRQLAKKYNLTIDWTKVEQVVVQANGIPTPILAHSSSLQEFSANALLLSHPDRLYQQPIAGSLPANTWSVTAATLNDSKTAHKLAVLLNHQGPTIPARVVEQGSVFQVVTGPFASSKEAKTALKRIQLEFELNGKVNPPQSSSYTTFSSIESKKIPQLDTPSEDVNFFEKWFNSLL
jgi:L,D-transpeptidase ErfK/SrfK